MLRDEDALTRKFRALAGRGPRALVRGIGDDCAEFVPGHGSHGLLTVDSFVEGVHFLRPLTPPRDIGLLAAAAALSDLAAMAARPAYALLSLKAPPETTEGDLLEIVRGVIGGCRASGAALVGGNLCADSKISLDLTVYGEAPAGQTVGRTPARAGDGVWVTGTLGAGRARHLWYRAGRPAGVVTRARLFPRPRVEEALFLARALRVRALIDLSDGLVKDLSRVCRANRLGAEIDSRALPLLSPGLAAKLAPGETPESWALWGGEDYELCLCTPEEKDVSGAFRKRFGVPLTRVGVLTRRPGLVLRRGTQTVRLVPGRGFDHFGRSGGRKHPE